MNENLRDWYQPPAAAQQKTTRYRSRHNPKHPPSYSTFTKNIPSEAPKAEKKVKKPTLRDTIAAKPVLSKFSTKNFIKDNAVEIILKKPPVINREPQRFVNKRDYGKVPNYLNKVKEDIDMERQLIEEFIMDARPGSGLEEKEIAAQDIAEADRLALINQLKRKWGHIHRQYQNIIGTDSKAKIQLKERYEEELSSLENDIKLLTRGPVRVSEEGC